ncbi:conserved hypothetical protein [Rubrivivax sp. A210]|uniref:PP0621 family protein n=1 Tax=Rubrivivax sp. A210 TaxID=2772301 RepID=UPI001917D30D|nr:PP0621 family protein [Rubrivivax sp. A210]CAD5374169.1 conserved hypothetical protein [Rubrivivax sp. A210]
MSRLFILLALVGVALWWLFGRRREPIEPPAAKPAKPTAAQPMLACAHCGVHVPRDDALCDSAGRAFCSEAHRLAGPR